MKQNKYKIDLNILSVFYLIILFSQIVGLMAGVISEYINYSATVNVLIQLLTEPKSFFNDNWIGVSVFSIILIPLNNLYYTIMNTQYDGVSKKRNRNYLEYIFCIINVLMYCEVYNIEKIEDNIEYIKSNILSFCITIVVVVCVILLSNFLSKYIVAKNAKNDILDEIVSREEHKANEFSYSKDGKAGIKVEFNNDLSDDKKEILKHPFSYAYENYKLYRARRKAIKYTNRLEIKRLEEQKLLEEAQKEGYSGNASVAFIIISIFVFLSLIAAVVIGIYENIKDGLGDENGFVSEIFHILTELLKNVTDGLEIAEPNIISFIMAFGIIILGFISYIIVVYAFTYMWKVWRYSSKKANGNSEKVKHFVDSIEKLFSNTIDEVINLLMFIPDILSNIIGIVYTDDEQLNDENSGEDK